MKPMEKSALRFSAAALALSVLAATPSWAQVPAQQGTVADPGRVESQITLPRATPSTVPQIEVRDGPAQAAPAGAENITFVLNDIRFDGVSAYSPDQLRAFYASSIGQTISLADLYGIANAMTRKFRNDGYILTQVIVPPQTIDGGTVRLQVVEGYVSRVSVALESGARAEGDAAMSLINDMAARISTGRALNVRDLERYMLLINDLPGVRARGVLAPSPTEVGAAELSVLLQRDPFEAVIGVDNYGTRFLGPVQFSGAASFNSAFGYNERLTAQVALAPEPGDGLELGYIALNYSQPLLPNGLRLDVNTSYTGTDPGYTLKQFDVKGISRFLGISLSYPFIRTRATSLYTSMTLDLRNVDTRNNIEDTRKDRIRAARLAARLEHLDTLFGAGLNVADLQLSRGLDIMGASSRNNPNKSRADADGEFTKLNAEVQRLQRITPQVNLLLAARGQLSSGALLSSEEFGVGGMGYGRGYDPSEIVGDDGIAGKVELQWNLPPQFDVLTSNQLFGFYDVGRVWNDDPAAAGLERQSAASAGFGIRAKIMDATSADLTVAFPLTRRVQTMGDKDARVFMSLSHRF